MLIRLLIHCLMMFLLVWSETTLNAQDAEKSPPDDLPKLETTVQKASYAIGFDIGRNLKNQGLEIEPSIIAFGIAAAMQGKQSVLSQEEIAEVFTTLRAEVQKKNAEKAKKNQVAGREFLEKNKAEKGIKVTKSGLQYLVVKEGTGANPQKTSNVSAHYKGKLIDGTVFDGSYEGEAPTEADKPVQFDVGGVIAGWTEALQLMKVGAHYRLFIPSELAYRESGSGSIGPNSVLIFDVYLMDSQD